MVGETEEARMSTYLVVLTAMVLAVGALFWFALDVLAHISAVIG